MAYDEKLAGRVRDVLAARSGVTEKKMFGGLAFLVHGHMICGVLRDELMVRVGPAAYEAALARPHARVMDFTGRPLTGMVYVGAAGVRGPASLRRWVALAVTFADALPPKRSGRRRPRGARSAKRGA